MGSPSKLTSASTSNSMENSNFDPIARLAPVVSIYFSVCLYCSFNLIDIILLYLYV